mmetsp:Transcript_56074/g.133565  ORF Transcript_56074/g.133565 Transcript_56074/m.133565 type:complete len:110 (+) Transcript_56074:760-1089(+)
MRILAPLAHAAAANAAPRTAARPEDEDLVAPPAKEAVALRLGVLLTGGVVACGVRTKAGNCRAQEPKTRPASPTAATAAAPLDLMAASREDAVLPTCSIDTPIAAKCAA